MTHDDACELTGGPCRICETWVTQTAPHCHCGSRACPLCTACRDGKHLQHADVNPATGKACACDLCEVAA